jgi:hypothetical protein
MESWRVVILGDGDVGKTALAVQVCLSFHSRSPRGLVIANLNISLVYAQLLCRLVWLLPNRSVLLHFIALPCHKLTISSVCRRMTPS